MCNTKRHTSLPFGCVLELRHNLCHLFTPPNARNHDASSSKVKHTGKGNDIRIRNPYHRHDFRTMTERDHFGNQRNVAAAMFHIEEHELSAGRSEHGSYTRSKQLEYHEPINDLALLQLFLDWIHAKA